MPELTWIGKGAVVRHHAEVPFRLLEEVKELSCPSTGGDTENLIVKGIIWRRSKHCSRATPGK
jgi:adenine-specific DNA-methyltransferase